MNNQFSRKEIPTYPGFLVGIRAMGVSYEGRIESPQQYHVWRSGVNYAQCFLAPYYTRSGLSDHRIASLGCGCGFYAYFHRKNARVYLPDRDGVYAIVKAYGRVTHGDLGFRAEKMEILALINLTAKMEPVAPKQPGRWPLIMVWLGVAFAAFCLVAAVFRDATTWPWIGYALGGGMAVSFLWYRQYRLNKFFEDFRSFSRRRAAWVNSQLSPWIGTSDRYVKSCKSRYPEIPWYDSLDAALKDFPLSKRVHKE